ncbi:MAG TPA: hypothetical protein VNN62_18425 [Methylomirabilota bacterium]|jgi:hypothetical protein|nr:hypothetical protein [Methylomirabilota bacterium]
MKRSASPAFVYPTVKAALTALAAALKDYQGSWRTAAERWGRPRSPGVDPTEAVRTLRTVYHSVARTLAHRTAEQTERGRAHRAFALADARRVLQRYGR